MNKPDPETVELLAHLAGIAVGVYVFHRIKIALIKKALQPK